MGITTDPSRITMTDVAVSSGPVAADPRPFDFRHPSTLSRDDARVLQVVQESLAHGIAANLASSIRASIDVTVAGVEHTPYGEFVRRSPNPSSLTVMRIAPIASKALLQFDPVLSFAMIELLLGSPGTTPAPERAHTEVEDALLVGLIETLLPTIDEAFEPLGTFTSSVVGQESNPTFVQIAPATDMVVVIGLDVAVDAQRGALRLVVPAAALRPHLDALTDALRDLDDPSDDRSDALDQVAGHIASVDVSAVVRFDPSLVSPSQLAELAVGDVFVLDHGVDAPLVAEVDGVPVHDVSIGRVKRTLAVEVLGPAPTRFRRPARVFRVPAERRFPAQRTR